MACAQLHTLKMTMGMTADKYMAKLEMLAGRTGFNEVALEDTFIWGLPQLILSKVYSHTLLLSGLDNWKTVVCNLDCLNRGFAKMKHPMSDLNANPSDVDPSYHPHSRHIHTHGH